MGQLFGRDERSEYLGETDIRDIIVANIESGQGVMLRHVVG